MALDLKRFVRRKGKKVYLNHAHSNIGTSTDRHLNISMIISTCCSGRPVRGDHKLDLWREPVTVPKGNPKQKKTRLYIHPVPSRSLKKIMEGIRLFPSHSFPPLHKRQHDRSKPLGLSQEGDQKVALGVIESTTTTSAQDATVPLHHSTLVRVKYILQHLL
jgi:hypothetical protein